MTVISPSTTTDLYPTRTGERTEVLDRRGPIAYGSVEQGPLDAKSLQHYDDKGYLTIDELVARRNSTRSGPSCTA